MASPPAPTNAELETLLSRIALGDHRAFEQLYRATSAHLLGVAYGVMLQRERAEEVLQEAYLNVWHAAGSFKGQLATPMTWLINIVRNKAIDRQRVGAGLRSAQVVLDDEATQVPDEAEREPQQLVHSAFVRAHIDSCMDSLAAGQRQALALAFFRGLAHAEIAETMGAPLGTVKAWVRRGGDRLRDCLRAAGVRGAS
ncbi:MAG: RNA polymerase subunit sigma-24 [Leptothrix sp. (in: Bacteria)]|nr:RNA polymerase subunit sigma-24 [Leptothrix sp. (in: b-proteobacteria)]